MSASARPQWHSEVRKLEGECERLRRETDRLIQRWLRLEAWWLAQEPADAFAGIPGPLVLRHFAAALTYDDSGPDLIHGRFQEHLALRRIAYQSRTLERLRDQQDRYETSWMTLQAWAQTESQLEHWNRKNGTEALFAVRGWIWDWWAKFGHLEDIPQFAF
ncbi:MAG: hypothetical protein HS116_13595 [Planctomycetes bacterium]|nr:hypothetical protein [Planctomycetota bacterium]